MMQRSAWLILGVLTLTMQAPASAQIAQKTPAECGVKPIPAYLSLSIDDFDQKPGEGWRAITLQDGCDAAAVDVIRQYREAKFGSPSPKDAQDIRRIDSLYRHEAMGSATAGQTARALTLFRWLVDYERLQGSDPSNIYRHEAAIAFLERDRAKLEKVRADLAALPRPDWFSEAEATWKQRFPDRPPMIWPQYLGETDNLIACFDKSYAEARSCPARAKPTP